MMVSATCTLRGKRGFVRALGLLVGISLASSSTAESAGASTNQVEVRLIKELTFDSEIQILRVKDGFPRLVVTEKTINWLDRDGNVETRLWNPIVGRGRTGDASPSSATIKVGRVFASDNGEWVAVVEYEMDRSGSPSGAILHLHDASGVETRAFPIEPLGNVSICDAGEPIAVHGLRAFTFELDRNASCILYDGAGNRIAGLRGTGGDRWLLGAAVSFGPDCSRALVEPTAVLGRDVTLSLLDGTGAVIWTRELAGPRAYGQTRMCTGFSSDGARLLATAEWPPGSDQKATLYVLDISSQILGSIEFSGELIHEMLPSPDFQRCLVRYRTTVRCIDLTDVTEVWNFSVPAEMRDRCHVLRLAWSRTGQFSAVWATPSRLDGEDWDAHAESALFLFDGGGRLAWSGSPGDANHLHDSKWQPLHELERDFLVFQGLDAVYVWAVAGADNE